MILSTYESSSNIASILYMSWINEQEIIQETYRDEGELVLNRKNDHFIHVYFIIIN